MKVIPALSTVVLAILLGWGCAVGPRNNEVPVVQEEPAPAQKSGTAAQETTAPKTAQAPAPKTAQVAAPKTAQAAAAPAEAPRAVTPQTVSTVTLAYHLATNAALRAARFSGSYQDTVECTAPASKNLDRLTNAVWSANFWLSGVHGLSATPIGFSNYLGAAGLPTLVSPRHYLCATHMHPEGATLAFLDVNNRVHWRRTLQRVDVSSDLLVDISVGILDADLPPSVEYLPVVPTNLMQYLPASRTNVVQGIGMNQDLRLFSQPMTFEQPKRVRWDSRLSVPFGLGPNWGVALRAGDSSAPEMLLVGQQLVLLSHNYIPQGGPNYAFYFEAINGKMHFLSTNHHAGSDYQLTPFSLAGWPQIR